MSTQVPPQTGIALGSEIIFLNKNWNGFKGLGWRDLDQNENFRVLVRDQVFRREALILDNTDGDRSADFLFEFRHSKYFPFRVIYHSFREESFKASIRLDILLEKPFKFIKKKAIDGSAIIYDRTFLIAIQRPHCVYLASLSNEMHRKLNKAQRSGALVRSNVELSQAYLSWFARNYAKFAKLRSISSPSFRYLDYLAKVKNLMGFYVEKHTGEIICAALIGIAKPNAVFLYGFSTSPAKNGEAHFMHTEIVKELQNHEILTYDLCGFPDPEIHGDGLLRFKKSLGGDLVSFGQEQHFENYAYQKATGLSRVIRKSVININSK